MEHVRLCKHSYMIVVILVSLRLTTCIIYNGDINVKTNKSWRGRYIKLMFY